MADSFSSTDGQLYIHELTAPYKSVLFQFYPDKLSFDRAIKSVDTGAFGYNNSGDEYLTGDDFVAVKLRLYASDAGRISAHESAQMLRSFGQRDGVRGSRPTVGIVGFGTIFNRHRYVQKSFHADYSMFDKRAGNNAAYIEVDVSYKRVLKRVTTLAETRNVR